MGLVFSMILIYVFGRVKICSMRFIAILTLGTFLWPPGTGGILIWILIKCCKFLY
ncbi:MAG: hypothetical protein E7J94_13590 [Clostridium sp.]|uniref:Uncharacterized protein n=1 Tax=Faecalicatena contorta TaxID=39482 RepID=A0A174AWV2_9FIRM|nr:MULTISPECIES: hypothetical protein [Clostridia]MDU7708292.1 hypothetical protein [Clostridium sp.]MSC84667.1 hypothetical protein [Eubacterium sp. BIOML-A1]MSD07069.1 hypothetical protein [Eubacterium sp. BIOML-A2]CUN93047.1 Uncharacterised protein [[Eubacterium] contortum] [Faecalicatena contorta]